MTNLANSLCFDDLRRKIKKIGGDKLEQRDPLLGSLVFGRPSRQRCRNLFCTELYVDSAVRFPAFISLAYASTDWRRYA
jgi:hypothetical protein